MILPGNDYEFGVNESGDENRGIHAKKMQKKNPFFLHLYSAQRNVQKQREKADFLCIPVRAQVCIGG